jgi:hypothetical protein
MVRSLRRPAMTFPAAAMLTPSPAHVPSPRPGWTLFRGAEYRFFETKVIFNAAEADCNSQGGHLASVLNSVRYFWGSRLHLPPPPTPFPSLSPSLFVV